MSQETHDSLRQVTLTQTGEGHYAATNRRGGVLPIGSGDDPDFTPVELLLAALAGCASIDVAAITGKRSAAERFDVRAEGDKVRDEQGNHLTNLRVSFDIAFPEGGGGRRRPGRAAALDRAVPRPVVHGQPHGRAGHPGGDGRRRVTVVALWRYPVKSLVGEEVEDLDIDERGVVGDRLWSVRDPDGKFGSGKSSRRFRKMDGLLGLRAAYDGDVPVLSFPDGRDLRGDDPAVHAALSAHVGRPVTLERESDVPHFDEGPLHVVTTAQLARMSALHDRRVDVRRLRANLVLHTAGEPVLDEDAWTGRTLRVGTAVLQVREPMTRCVMVGMAQVDVPADGGLLDTVTRENRMNLGLVVDVVRPGHVALGDPATAL